MSKWLVSYTVIRTIRVYAERSMGVWRVNSGKTFLRNLHSSRDLKDELELARCHRGEQEGLLQMYVNNSGRKGAPCTVGL